MSTTSETQGTSASNSAPAGARISVVVITKNEAHNIDACLRSVAWADEVLVVDAESTDATVELARRFTPHVFVRPWPGYGPQKNFAIGRTTGDWILIVDADEQVTPELAVEIRRMVGTADRAGLVGFEIPRRNYFYGRWVRGGGVYPDYQLRLIRRGKGLYDDTELHERIHLDGPQGRLTHDFLHQTSPTIASHLAKVFRYSTLGAQEKMKRHSEVTGLQVIMHPLGAVLKNWLLRRGYQDGIHGVFWAGFSGVYTFLKYAKIWEAVHVPTSMAAAASERRTP
ncbi:MAG: glycosyltransferase family 2 protein [Nitrospiraceae bacterium]